MRALLSNNKSSRRQRRRCRRRSAACQAASLDLTRINRARALVDYLTAAAAACSLTRSRARTRTHALAIAAPNRIARRVCDAQPPRAVRSVRIDESAQIRRLNGGGGGGGDARDNTRQPQRSIMEDVRVVYYAKCSTTSVRSRRLQQSLDVGGGGDGDGGDGVVATNILPA